MVRGYVAVELGSSSVSHKAQADESHVRPFLLCLFSLRQATITQTNFNFESLETVLRAISLARGATVELNGRVYPTSKGKDILIPCVV